MENFAKITQKDIIEKLLETNVKIQQANANLLIVMTDLTKKIDELINIFKKAAEHIEKGEIKEPLARKLTDLLEQNKRIAKGLLLLENFVREREGFGTQSKKDFEDIF